MCCLYHRIANTEKSSKKKWKKPGWIMNMERRRKKQLEKMTEWMVKMHLEEEMKQGWIRYPHNIFTLTHTIAYRRTFPSNYIHCNTHFHFDSIFACVFSFNNYKPEPQALKQETSHVLFISHFFYAFNYLFPNLTLSHEIFKTTFSNDKHIVAAV